MAYGFRLDRTLQVFFVWKQDAIREPDCGHVEHFCETRDLNSCVRFPPATDQCVVDTVEYGRGWSAKCGVLSVE